MLYTGSHFLIKALIKKPVYPLLFPYVGENTAALRNYLFSVDEKIVSLIIILNYELTFSFLSLIVFILVFSFCSLQLPFPALSHPQIRHIPTGCPAIR